MSQWSFHLFYIVLGYSNIITNWSLTLKLPKGDHKSVAWTALFITLLHFFQMNERKKRREREEGEEAGSVGCGQAQGPSTKKVTFCFIKWQWCIYFICDIAWHYFYDINVDINAEASEAKGKNFHILLATLSNMYLLVSVQEPMRVLGGKKRHLWIANLISVYCKNVTSQTQVGQELPFFLKVKHLD